MCLIICGWLFAFSFAYGAKDAATALSWFSIGFIFIPFIPAATYLFMNLFLEPTTGRKITILIIWCLSFFFMFAQLKNNAIFSSVQQFDWGFYNPHTKFYGISFVIFLSSTMALIVLEIFLAYLNIPQERTIKIARFKILLFSLLISSLGTIDFLPSYGINSPPLGFCFILIFLLLFYHAVKNLKILDLNRYISEKIIETMNDALFVCDTDGIIHKVNHCAIKLTKNQECDLIEHKLACFLVKNKNTDKETILTFLTVKEPKKSFEAILNCSDQSSIPVSVSVSEITNKNKCYGWVIIAHDITDYKKNIQQLLYLSNHDYLTKIFNRKRFEELLDYHIKFSLRNNYTSALLIFDIDHFKQVNDTYGHPCGDKVLVEFTKRIQSCLRETDVIARLGGDEFAAILSNIAPQSIESLSTKLLKTITSKPMVHENQTIDIKCSIGVTLIPAHGDNVATLVKHADLALYHCKNYHRNSYIIYSEQL